MHNARMAVWVLCTGVVAPGLVLLVGRLCARSIMRMRSRIDRSAGLSTKCSPSWGWPDLKPSPESSGMLIGRIRRGLVAQSAVGLAGGFLWGVLMFELFFNDADTRAGIVLAVAGIVGVVLLGIVSTALAACQEGDLRYAWSYTGVVVRSAMDEIGAAWSLPLFVGAFLPVLFPPVWPAFWLPFTVWNQRFGKMWERVGAATGSTELEAAAGKAARSWGICFLASVLLMLSLTTMLFRSANLLFPLLLSIPLPLFAIYATVHLYQALRLAADQLGARAPVTPLPQGAASVTPGPAQQETQPAEQSDGGPALSLPSDLAAVPYPTMRQRLARARRRQAFRAFADRTGLERTVFWGVCVGGAWLLSLLPFAFVPTSVSTWGIPAMLIVLTAASAKVTLILFAPGDEALSGRRAALEQALPAAKAAWEQVRAKRIADEGETYRERDNVGIRQETLLQATAYWTARLAGRNSDAFVLYVFDEEADARDALLELGCMHVARDSGKVICTETLVFGYYKVAEGVYEAMVCGDDLSLDLWETARSSFSSHGGSTKEERAPEARQASSPSRRQRASGRAKFGRAGRRGHSPPCDDMRSEEHHDRGG